MPHDLSKFNHVPIAEITTPSGGRIVYPESWWVVTPEREVLFYTKHKDHVSPQCNTNRQIVDGWIENFPNCTVERLPLVYLKHNCNDYV